MQPAHSAPPDGLFAVGYRDQLPVVMGGWRLHEPDDPQTGWASPAAEIKRMYVVAAARGAGFARQMLAFLERTAGDRGARWVLLETGSKQPEAIALYRSAGLPGRPAVRALCRVRRWRCTWASRSADRDDRPAIWTPPPMSCTRSRRPSWIGSRPAATNWRPRPARPAIENWPVRSVH